MTDLNYHALLTRGGLFYYSNFCSKMTPLSNLHYMKFKMAATTKLSDLIINSIIMFLDPEGMGRDTKSMSLRFSQTELITKAILDSGHFEIQNGCLNQATHSY